MRRTIAELNKKAWYRLLKGIYTITLCTLCFFIVFIIFDEHGPGRIIDPLESKIVCDNGKIYRMGDVDNRYVRWQDTRAINTLCSKDKLDREDTLHQLFAKPEPEEKYKIEYAYIKTGSWWKASVKSIIGVLVILILFLIIKHVFYYIALDKVFPPKE